MIKLINHQIILERENKFIQQYLSQKKFTNILLIGNNIQKILLNNIQKNYSIILNYEFNKNTTDNIPLLIELQKLKIVDDSIDLIIMPHILEFEFYYEIIIQYLYNKLKSCSYLLIFSFNKNNIQSLAKKYQIEIDHKLKLHSIEELSLSLKKNKFHFNNCNKILYYPKLFNTKYQNIVDIIANICQLPCPNIFAIIAKKYQAKIIKHDLIDYNSTKFNDKIAIIPAIRKIF